MHREYEAECWNAENVLYTSTVAGDLTFSDFFLSKCMLHVGESVPEVSALLLSYWESEKAVIKTAIEHESSQSIIKTDTHHNCEHRLSPKILFCQSDLRQNTDVCWAVKHSTSVHTTQRTKLFCMCNNENASTNNDIIYKLELVMMDSTHSLRLQKHSHTRARAHTPVHSLWVLSYKTWQKISACAKIQPTLWALMKFKAWTRYGSNVNTHFCQVVSVDVCGFHGDRGDAEERAQSGKNQDCGWLFFVFSFVHCYNKGWIGLVESWREDLAGRLTHCTSKIICQQICVSGLRRGGGGGRWERLDVHQSPIHSLHLS